MKTVNRYFEVVINSNFFFPAYTLEVTTPEIAIKKATKEAKLNKNSTVDIIEVDENNDAIENGFVSGTIKIV